MNIIQEIKKLNIPTDEFVVVGSSILVMHGIRKNDDIDDIDLLVSERIFDNLKQNGWKSRFIKFEDKQCENLINGFFEVGREYWNEQTVDFFKNNSDRLEIFDNVRFQSLKEFYEIKKSWKREKDLEDIILVENYYKNL